MDPTRTRLGRRHRANPDSARWREKGTSERERDIGERRGISESKGGWQEDVGMRKGMSEREREGHWRGDRDVDEGRDVRTPFST